MTGAKTLGEVSDIIPKNFFKICSLDSGLECKKALYHSKSAR
mgnify:CR=1 FL=1